MYKIQTKLENVLIILMYFYFAWQADTFRNFRNFPGDYSHLGTPLFRKCIALFSKNLCGVSNVRRDVSGLVGLLENFCGFALEKRRITISLWIDLKSLRFAYSVHEKKVQNFIEKIKVKLWNKFLNWIFIVFDVFSAFYKCVKCFRKLWNTLL